MKRTGLQRKTPLRATKPIKRVSIVPGKSTVNPTRMKPWRPTKTTEETLGRKIVSERADEHCERCGLQSDALEWHHRRNRSQGGLWDPANGMALDRACHHFVTVNPEASDKPGWTVLNGEDPRTKPVLYRGRWVLLDNDGRVFPSPDPGGTTDGC